MAEKKIKSTKKKAVKADPKKDLKKLFFSVVIVPDGLSSSILKLLNNIGISASFIQKGRGTATRQVRDILGIEDNNKEIIYSVVNEDKVEEISKEIKAFFSINRRNRGIAFTVPLTGIISMRIYSFLADSL